jgi:hypothetical protein
LCTPRKTLQSINHPEIAQGQARLTPGFFVGGLPEKKVYLDGMSILSILLSLESGCHTDLTSKPVVSFLVEPQNQGGGGFAGSGFKIGSSGLVICASKSPR